MATVQLGTKAVGSTVKIKVNGALRNFLVVHQGLPSSMYDASCNGTWLLMEDVYETRQWHSSDDNRYANSTIHSYLNGTFLNLIDSNIRSQIKQVKIPYGAGNSTSTVYSGSNGLSTKVFLLSGYEAGYTKENVNQFICGDGARLSYFLEGGNATGSEPCLKRIAYLNGTAALWWLRSPGTNYSIYTWLVHSLGYTSLYYASSAYGVRPAFILPSTTPVYSNNTLVNLAPTVPGAITLPTTVHGGTTITLSWSASTDEDGNLSGYKVERSIDGGTSWTQIHQSSATSCTDAITFGWTSVQYRVKAYDSEGAESGWRVSEQKTVINNNAPYPPPSITVPELITGGESATISWAAATDPDGNLAGYELERSDGGGAYTQKYRGSARTHTDPVTRGIRSVTWRVRAYDTHGAVSDYTTGPPRQVDNNAAPAIACGQTGHIGTKDSGFRVLYTVTDEDGDSVLVTEAIDGVTKRTFTATLGAQNAFDVTGETFQRLLNGERTLTITATDPGGKSALHTLTFTKAVHALRITLREPLPSEEGISRMVLSVARSIPADADFQILATNNALDEEPSWEEITGAVQAGRNHLFENTVAERGFAFNLLITAARGESGLGGFVGSLGGAFE